jgi:hypothetical protein
MVLDYTLGRDVTDSLVVVKCDLDGAVVDVTMES